MTKCNNNVDPEVHALAVETMVNMADEAEARGLCLHCVVAAVLEMSTLNVMVMCNYTPLTMVDMLAKLVLHITRAVTADGAEFITHTADDRGKELLDKILNKKA